MKQINLVVENCDQLRDLLKSKTTLEEVGVSNSVLVQLFTDSADLEKMQAYTEIIKSLIPKAVIIGATSAGGISDGRLVQNSTTMSLSFFKSSGLVPFSLSCKPGCEYETGKELSESISSVPDSKAILLFASPIVIKCADLLHGIYDRNSEIVVIGGGAAGAKSEESFVFLDQVLPNNNNVIAIALTGKELTLEAIPITGWKALGPKITLTAVNGYDVCEINEAPAFDVYSKYFGLFHEDDLFLLEFPLLIERDGITLARNPISSSTDGSVSLIADIHQGEHARLGYLDLDRVIENMKNTVIKMEEFAPEAIYIFSCICRKFSLQQDVEIETLPFQRIAPVSGLFTYGEFCNFSNHLELLNSSEVIVGIREGNRKPISHNVSETINNDADHYRLRHVKITSRLFNFIAALTDQLEEANQTLKIQAYHDPLTGALNRHTLSENIDAEIANAKRHGRDLSFILFDIDHFKQLNDQYGHQAGDQVLRRISNLVRESTRLKDALYRYGGEEFLMILPETPLTGAETVANKLKEIIAESTFTFNGKSLPKITASFGVACFPDHGTDAEGLIASVDQALYCAKGLGRNVVSVAIVS